MSRRCRTSTRSEDRWSEPPQGRDRFHTVPIISLALGDFTKGNMETRAHQIYPPTPPRLKRRQEKSGTERVPTARWDLLRARNAMTRMCFLATKRSLMLRASLHSLREIPG